MEDTWKQVNTLNAKEINALYILANIECNVESCSTCTCPFKINNKCILKDIEKIYNKL